MPQCSDALTESGMPCVVHYDHYDAHVSSQFFTCRLTTANSRKGHLGDVLPVIMKVASGTEDA